MQYFNYDEIFEECEEELLKEAGFESFEDYRNATNSKKSDFELKRELIQAHFKNEQKDRDTLGVFGAGDYAHSDFKYIKIDGKKFINIVDIFLENFSNRVQYSLESAITGQQVFKELIKKGANKEQVTLQLLMAEKELRKSLIEEKSKGRKADKELILSYEKQLEDIADYHRKLYRIKSPYDKMFEISQEIAELKQEENKLLEKVNLSKAELGRLDRIAEEVEKKENWLAKEMSKYDPRIVEDVINDKISSLKLEIEIDNIKKGKEITNDEANEVKQLKIGLTALKKQVNKDLRIIEQNQQLNV